MLLINLGQTSVFTSVTSISVVIVYLAYLFVTVPRLWHRLRRSARHEAGPGLLLPGSLGTAGQLVAVVFGVFLLVNIGWPRQAVYDPDGSSAVLQYSAPLAVVVVVLLGLARLRVSSAARPGRPRRWRQR